MGVFGRWFSPQTSRRKIAAAQAEADAVTQRQGAIQQQQLDLQKQALAKAEEQVKKTEENVTVVGAEELAKVRARSGGRGIRALMSDASIQYGSTLGNASTLGSNV
jgi:hypothetical protein